MESFLAWGFHRTNVKHFDLCCSSGAKYTPPNDSSGASGAKFTQLNDSSGASGAKFTPLNDSSGASGANFTQLNDSCGTSGAKFTPPCGVRSQNSPFTCQRL